MPERITGYGEEYDIATTAETHKALDESPDRDSSDYLKRHIGERIEGKHIAEVSAKENPLVLDIDKDLIEANKNGISLRCISHKTDPYKNKILKDFRLSKEDPDDWRMMDDIRLSNPKSEAILRIRDVVPRETMIIFKTTEGPQRNNCSMPSEDKCVMTENITKPRAILSLLHEIGHLWAEKNLDENDKDRHAATLSMLNYSPSIGNDQWALLMLVERDAWAFALKTIRPFLGKSQDEGLLTREQAKEIIDLSLQSYSDVFKQQIYNLMKD